MSVRHAADKRNAHLRKGGTAMKTAFALGGLGGNNAHTAGFLAAANEMKVIPDVISCTSGPIFWVCEYLKGHDLNQYCTKMPRDRNKMQRLFDPAHWEQVLEVMRPAIPEYWLRWMKPWQPLDPKEWFDRMLPAQILTESHDDEWFNNLAETLDKAEIDGKKIGIVFNTFEPETATEYLHANATALYHLGKHVGDKGHGGVEFAAIDGCAVKDSLRLYWYGFEGATRIDGAYHRQIILRDLHNFERIYAVRPQNQRWLGGLPKNSFEVCDMIFELWFNSSYAGEIAMLNAVSDLVREGVLPKARFVDIDIVEVSILRNRGFIEYCVETADVFETAREQTRLILQEKARQDAAMVKQAAPVLVAAPEVVLPAALLDQPAAGQTPPVPTNTIEPDSFHKH